MKAMICGTMLAAAVLGGCSGNAVPLLQPEMGLMRLAIFDDANQARRLEKAMTDPEIADLLDADIKAKLPTAIAVAKVRSGYGGEAPHLELLSAEELQGWAGAVEGQPLVRGVRPVSQLLQTSDSVGLSSLRRSAARMGCELLLVYLQGDSSVDNYNDGAILYWTLVGLWLVPGNTYEHLCVMQAILVDCRTGAVLGTATGEGRLSRLHAAAYQEITRGQLAREAPRKALADVQKSFAKTLADVVQAARKDAKEKGPALTGWAQ